MYKVTLVVPKADNNGRAFSEQLLAQIEKRIIDVAGGFSRAEICGQWKEENRIYTDYSFMYTVICDEDKVNELRDLTKAFLAILKQIAMYFESYPVNVEFLS